MTSLYPGVIAILCLFFSLYNLLLVAADSQDDPLKVSIDNGVLIGKQCDSGFAAYEFLGIPFAQPPTGDLRFRPTVYYDTPYPETGFNATTFPPGCGTPCDNTGISSVVETIGEDCLFLNVFVPKNESREKLPVRVYIHGGSFRYCRISDAMLTGCSSAAYSNMIIVTIQYRLGALGYLAHPQTLIESNTTGNWGTLDQQMGLKWVQKNIASFGGDPNQVLLYGGSSGGISVALHNIMPGSAGLFHSALAQSCVCNTINSLEDAYIVRAELSANMGCASEDSAEELACLRAANVSSFTNATADYTLDANCFNRTHFAFSPTIDGTVIPMGITDAFNSGNFNKVPLMVGMNKDEGTTFINPLFEDAWNIQMNELYAFIENVYPGVDPAKVLALYPEEDYANSTYPMYSRVVDFIGDIFVKCPGYEMLNAHSKQGIPTYSYYFTHTPTCPVNNMYLGATHASELLFVFRNLVDVTPPGGGCDFNDSERELSDAIQVAWSSMATKGYPMFANGTSWPQWVQNSTLSTQLDTDLAWIDAGLGDRCGPLAVFAKEAEAAWNSFMKREGPKTK